jgi:hypothetical protein
MFARRPRDRTHGLSHHPALRLNPRHHPGHTAKLRRVAVEGRLGKMLPAREVGDLLGIGHREPEVGRAQAIAAGFVQGPRDALDVIDLAFEILLQRPLLQRPSLWLRVSRWLVKKAKAFRPRRVAPARSWSSFFTTSLKVCSVGGK